MSDQATARITFAKNMRRFRQDRHIRLKEISYTTGLSYNYLSAVENMKYNISIDNAEKVARSLGLPLVTLLIDM